MPYHDYRQSVQSILDTLSDSSSSLTTGAIAIANILKMAQYNDPDIPAQTIESNISDSTNTESKTPETKETVPKTVPPEPVKLEDQKVLQVKRQLSGFNLIDPKQETDPNYNYHYSEQTLLAYGLEHHDLVEVNPTHDANRSPRILKVVKYAHEPHPDIRVAHLYLIEFWPDKNKYFVTEKYDHHEKLADINPYFDKFQIPEASIKKANIKDGKLIDLAWYVNAPDNISIRYIYPDDQLDDGPKPQKASFYKEKEAGIDYPVSTLNFSLNNKTVAIVVGDTLREAPLQKLVHEHAGHLVLIDAFKHGGSGDFYDQQLKQGIDYIVMVQNQNKHATSKALNKAVQKYGLTMTIADGLGLSQIERAIYRAVKKLPAYEGQLDINYPTK